MEAPDTFHPVNIMTASRGFPPPIRLGYTKSELYGDLTHLNTVDEHAIKVSCNLISMVADFRHLVVKESGLF